MKLTELFAAQLEREAAVTKRVVERVPEGKPDWKPHEKSMALGYLSALVATMPGWVALTIDLDELDLNPPGGSRYTPRVMGTTRELVQALDESAAKSRAALARTSDEHLMKPWRLAVGGRVVSSQPRHVVLGDAFTHLAHHRGQLSVYLRLNGAAVPSIYGPSADERIF
jgi:uncharacterized damage-inducible protein DinB